jgi:integrase
VEAKKLLGMIASGDDPSSVRDGAKSAPHPTTVSELCDEYLAAAKAGAVLTRFNRPKKTSTLSTDVGRIERHIKPLIGSLSVVNMDSRVVKRLIQDITVGKTAVIVKTRPRGRALVKGGASTAARVADLLSGMMTWAVDEGLISSNPVHKVRRYRSEPRERFLNDDELALLGDRLRIGADLSGRNFHPFAAAVIKLLCLTGCRSSEIATLRWLEVDLDNKCLRLEDTKSGRSLRAIGTRAVQLLEGHPKVKEQTFVFPGAKGQTHYQGLNKEAPRVFRSAGLDNVTCHVLRHTFASVASELGYSDGTIAGMLGHKGRGVTSRYVHRPDSALALAAEEVSSEIWRRMNPKLKRVRRRTP